MSVQIQSVAQSDSQQDGLNNTILQVTPRILVDRVRLLRQQGQNGKIRQLLQTGALNQTDVDGKNALHYAALDGDVDLVSFLVGEAQLNVDSCDSMGYTALHHAATYGHREVIAALIEHGGCVNRHELQHGFTALHEVAFHGFSESLSLLLANGANVNAVTLAGFTALHFAAQNGHNESARILLRAGCNRELKNMHGDTVLHTAARYGHAGVTRILISAHCNVNETNKNGDTALHIAAALKRHKIAVLLIDAGASSTVRNRQKDIPVNIAARKGHTEICDLLLYSERRHAADCVRSTSMAQSGSSASTTNNRRHNESPTPYQTAVNAHLSELAADKKATIDNPGETPSSAPAIQECQVAEQSNAITSNPLGHAADVAHLAATNVLLTEGEAPIDSKKKTTVKKRAAQFFTRLFKRKSKECDSSSDTKQAKDTMQQSAIHACRCAPPNTNVEIGYNCPLAHTATSFQCQDANYLTHHATGPTLYGYRPLPPALKVHEPFSFPAPFSGAGAPPLTSWLYPASAMHTVPNYVRLNEFGYAEYHGTPMHACATNMYPNVKHSYDVGANYQDSHAYHHGPLLTMQNLNSLDQQTGVGTRLFRARSDESLSVSENKQRANAEKAQRIAMNESRKMKLHKLGSIPQAAKFSNVNVPRHFSFLNRPTGDSRLTDTSVTLAPDLASTNRFGGVSVGQAYFTRHESLNHNAGFIKPASKSSAANKGERNRERL